MRFRPLFSIFLLPYLVLAQSIPKLKLIVTPLSNRVYAHTTYGIYYKTAVKVTERNLYVDYTQLPGTKCI